VPAGVKKPISPYCAFDMGGFQHVLFSRPMATGTESSSGGLDILAMAVACQSRN
jgi:hypothetical protein